MVINTYNDTKHHYRVILQDLVQFCFLALFGENEMRSEMQRTLERRTRLSMRKKEQDHFVGRRDKEEKKKSEEEPASKLSMDDDGEEEEISIKVAFPGVLDTQTINDISTMGLMTHEAKRRYVSMYLGIPEEDLAEEPMDPITGRPMQEVQQEQYEREDNVMKTQAKLQMSVKGPPKKGVGQRPAQKKPKTMGTGN